MCSLLVANCLSDLVSVCQIVPNFSCNSGDNRPASGHFFPASHAGVVSQTSSGFDSPLANKLKAVTVTVIIARLSSSLLGESLHLAGDFHRVCDNYFPHAELGQIIARQHVGTPEAQHRVSMVKATQ